MKNKRMKAAADFCAAAILTSSLSACAKKEEPQPAAEPTVISDTEISSTDVTEQNKQMLLDAFVAEAQHRVDMAGKPTEITGRISASSAQKTYPGQFDLRSVDRDGDGKAENYITSVKNQNPFGTCWAFATIAAAESSILYELGTPSVVKKADGSFGDAIDLSEHHIGWFTYTPLPAGDEQEGEGLYTQVDGTKENPSMRLSSGSTQFAASAVFASGIGPVAEPEFEAAEGSESALNYHGTEKITKYNESSGMTCYSEEDDWSIDESQRFRQTYMLEDIYFLAPPVSIYDAGNYDISYADSVSNSYKEQLMNGRAVSIAFCADNYMPYKTNKAAKYINNDTWAHYCYEPVRANHAVNIVGWDDDYPKENFLTQVQVLDDDGNPVFNEDGMPKMKTVSQPPENGAWIVKNSWGSIDSIGQGLNINNWGFEGSGYFYLSYYDQSIETAQCFDFDVENKLKHDLGEYVLEEHDLMPCEVPHSVNISEPVSAVNVFTVEENEIIKALSCTTTVCGEEVEFSVYRINGDEINMQNAVLLGKTSKTFDNAGLHVVSLDRHYMINKGEKIAIMVTQKYDGGYLLSVGSEFNQKGFDAGFCDDNYAAKAVVNKGESYVYIADDDVLLDFADIKSELEGMEGASSYLTYDNFPIKSYASIER